MVYNPMNELLVKKLKKENLNVMLNCNAFWVSDGMWTWPMVTQKRQPLPPPLN